MKNFFFFLLLVITVACKQGGDTYSKAEAITQEDPHPGKQFLETYCYACHSPDVTMDERIAPPMAAIQMHYINEDTTEEEFLEAFTSWVKEPSEANSKMPGAIRKFGLMPYAPYPEDVVRKIGEYLYNFDVDAPEGFQEHMQQEHGNGEGKGMGRQKRMRKGMGWQEPKKSYQEKGMEIAMSTKGVLGKNLLGTVQKKGVTAALAFCNEKAYPLTDSMAIAHNAAIKRVSDRYRNPSNKASAYEVSLIAEYQKQLNEKKDIQPVIDSSGTTVQFYYPIVTNDLCLKCHGNPTTNLEPGVMAAITSLYPEDHATGYDTNQVRGLWSIQMKKEQSW